MQQNELGDLARQTFIHIRELLNHEQSQIIGQGQTGLLIKHGDQIWKCVRIPCEIIPKEFYSHLKLLALIFNVIINNNQNETSKLQQLQNTPIKHYIPEMLQNRQISFSMKYINLGSLQNLLENVQGNLNSHTFNWISFQLFELIHSLHNTFNLVHLDIKPQNVMIEQYYELQYDRNNTKTQLEFNQGLVSILIKLYCGLQYDFSDLKKLKSAKQIEQGQYQQIQLVGNSNFQEFIQILDEEWHQNCQDIFGTLFQNEKTQNNTVSLLNGTKIVNAKSLISLILARCDTNNTINPYAFKIAKKYRLILIDFQFSKSIYKDNENFGFGTKWYMAPEIVNLLDNQQLEQINTQTDLQYEQNSLYILRQQQQQQLNQMDLRKCDLFSYGMLLFNLRFYSDNQRPIYSESQLQYYEEVANFLQNKIFNQSDPYPYFIRQLINQNPQFRPTYQELFEYLQNVYQNVDQNQVFIEFHSQIRNQFPQ